MMRRCRSLGRGYNRYKKIQEIKVKEEEKKKDGRMENKKDQYGLTYGHYQHDIIK